jgi:gamma-glutamyltranspeptidase/glutathione hydrolase
MSPTIVLDRKGNFAAATGSPGGTAIVGYVVKALVGMLDWKMTPQDAVALPNLVAHGNNYSADKFPDDITTALAARGRCSIGPRGKFRTSGDREQDHRQGEALRWRGGSAA